MRQALRVTCSACVVMLLATISCLAGRYSVSWQTAENNGWSNPLPMLGETLTTSTNYDFNSQTYTSNHDGLRHAGIDLVVPDGIAISAHAISNGEVVHVVRGADPREMVVIVQHQGARGSFYCVYGHVYAAAGIEEHVDVAAGQALGAIRTSGTPRHLHLGINTSSSLTTFKNPAIGRGWGTTVPVGTSAAVNPSSIGWVDPVEHLEGVQCATSLPSTSNQTATVLVMDVSGSMGWSWQGGVKIESAKEAALSFLELLEQENRVQGTEHWVAVVGFSADAHLLLPLTNDYNRARQTIISLHATSATNLGAGLTVGLQELSKLEGQAQRYMTVLSDGETNRGLSRNEILNGPVAQARSAGICINTVAFGDRGDIDEEFLRRIAAMSGCGRYEYASSGFELFSAYVKIRHHSLGQVISGLSSHGHEVIAVPGQGVPLGVISIPSGQRELHVTLGWSADGRMQLVLTDPRGRQVGTSYPGAIIYSSGSFAQASIASPLSGIWRVDAQAVSSMLSGTEYFAIASTRPGGIAFSLPLPVFEVGGFSFALPDWLPTWALVGISLACIAIAAWQWLSQAGFL